MVGSKGLQVVDVQIWNPQQLYEAEMEVLTGFVGLLHDDPIISPDKLEEHTYWESIVHGVNLGNVKKAHAAANGSLPKYCSKFILHFQKHNIISVRKPKLDV